MEQIATIILKRVYFHKYLAKQGPYTSSGTEHPHKLLQVTDQPHPLSLLHADEGLQVVLLVPVPLDAGPQGRGLEPLPVLLVAPHVSPVRAES